MGNMTMQHKRKPIFFGRQQHSSNPRNSPENSNNAPANQHYEGKQNHYSLWSPNNNNTKTIRRQPVNRQSFTYSPVSAPRSGVVFRTSSPQIVYEPRKISTRIKAPALRQPPPFRHDLPISRFSYAPISPSSSRTCRTPHPTYSPGYNQHNTEKGFYPPANTRFSYCAPSNSMAPMYKPQLTDRIATTNRDFDPQVTFTTLSRNRAMQNTYKKLQTGQHYNNMESREYEDQLYDRMEQSPIKQRLAFMAEGGNRHSQDLENFEYSPTAKAATDRNEIVKKIRTFNEFINAVKKQLEESQEKKNILKVKFDLDSVNKINFKEYKDQAERELSKANSISDLKIIQEPKDTARKDTTVSIAYTKVSDVRDTQKKSTETHPKDETASSVSKQTSAKPSISSLIPQESTERESRIARGKELLKERLRKTVQQLQQISEQLYEDNTAKVSSISKNIRNISHIIESKEKLLNEPKLNSPRYVQSEEKRIEKEEKESDIIPPLINYDERNSPNVTVNKTTAFSKIKKMGSYFERLESLGEMQDKCVKQAWQTLEHISRVGNCSDPEISQSDSEF